MNRRDFIKSALCGVTAGALIPSFGLAVEKKKPVNIMFITADDLNWDSIGVYGCPIKDITPNIDKLASQSVRFTYAYSTIAVCQPVRATMHTGLYPHHSGCEGFEPINQDVVTLNEVLHNAGYAISMFGKNIHYQPHDKFRIEFEWEQGGRKSDPSRVYDNRDPSRVYEFAKEAIARAKKQNKPFFNQINCADPHRPFYGTGGSAVKPSRIIVPAEVPLPKFLDEIPAARTEVAQYFCCVKRLDDCVGMAMKALEESGMADNTILMFYGGDHGMSFPFAKSNAYEQSNHGGLIVRWPGVVKPGTVDDSHMVSTIDFTPTLIEAAGLKALPNIDGRSFASILKGGRQDNRDKVFNCYYLTSAGKCFMMKSVRTMKDAYIWNAWSNGETEYYAENMSGLTWNAMVQAAKTNPEIKKRVDFYLTRVTEEYYDDGKDKGERNNLINDPVCEKRVGELQAEMQKFLTATGDPAAEIYSKRHDKAAMKKFMTDFMANRKNHGTSPDALGSGVKR